MNSQLDSCNNQTTKNSELIINYLSLKEKYRSYRSGKILESILTIGVLFQILIFTIFVPYSIYQSDIELLHFKLILIIFAGTIGILAFFIITKQFPYTRKRIILTSKEIVYLHNGFWAPFLLSKSIIPRNKETKFNYNPVSFRLTILHAENEIIVDLYGLGDTKIKSIISYLHK